MLLNSEIRTLIEALEDEATPGAQEVAVPFDQQSMTPAGSEENIDTAVAAGMAENPAPQGGGGENTGMNINQMPGGIGQDITVDKTLVNTELIKAILGEIKALVTNAERIFDREELESNDAEIYIGNLINSLATSTEKLAAFVQLSSEESMNQ